MSFLQPLFLLGLPLIALPIVIHLINQRRYQTVKWAAMMFLLAANRMSRGYARIRQWLILAFRTLALAGLALAICRPLAGGWLGLTAGGRADSTIVILDRSPSMQQAGRGSGIAKLEAGRRQLFETIGMLGPSRWVVIDQASGKPRALESVEELLKAADLGPSGGSADLPTMLQAARDHLEANRSGQTDIWICSDLRANDWDVESGRWATFRDAFRESSGRVRFHLLAYPQGDPGNLAVRVTGVRLQEINDSGELLISLRVVREGSGDAKQTVPVQFEIEGARSEVGVEISGREGDLKDHRISIEKGRARGWGKVSIPSDGNPADNAFWFVFDRPRPRRTVVVAEDPEAARPLQLAASIAPDPSVSCSAEVVPVEQLGSVEWETVSLLLWEAPLPEGESEKRVRSFVDRGGRVIFFPPKGATSADFLGARWKDWVEVDQSIPVDGWRGDQDLLAQTQSGAPLPVGQLQVRRYRAIEVESTPLATLKGGISLLSRVATTRGGVYFCSTTTNPGDSSLASAGVVLYVMVQRSMADGSSVLENVRQLSAGEASGVDPRNWRRLAGAEGGISTAYASEPGVYASGDRLFAVNRSVAEDSAAILTAPEVAGLFQGLDFRRVDDSADNSGSLVQEIWRLFLIAMMVAMVVEAGLCLPKRSRSAGDRA